MYSAVVVAVCIGAYQSLLEIPYRILTAHTLEDGDKWKKANHEAAKSKFTNASNAIAAAKRLQSRKKKVVLHVNVNQDQEDTETSFSGTRARSETAGSVVSVDDDLLGFSDTVDATTSGSAISLEGDVVGNPINYSKFEKWGY